MLNVLLVSVASLVWGLLGLAVLYHLFGRSIPFLSASGIMPFSIRVRVKCCILRTLFSFINEKIRFLPIHEKK